MTTTVSTHPTATQEPEALLRAYRATGDVRPRDAAIDRLMPLVFSLCRRYEGRAEWDDLVQVASLGLLKAVERYDPEHGASVSTFAVPTVLGELRRYFRDRTWAVRPPRGLQERWMAVHRAVSELTSAYGRSPSPTVVAERLGLSEEEVVDALVAGHGRAADSLDAPVRTDEPEAVSLGDSLGATDPELGRALDRTAIGELMRGLDPRARRALKLRFEDDLTQAEIGRIIGVSQMQVSRILRRAIAELRAEAGGGRAPASLARG